MKGKITGINPSGKFSMVFFKLENGKSARTYTGKEFRNYSVWNQFKIDDWVEGLEWKDEKRKLIDGDSPVHLA